MPQQDPPPTLCSTCRSRPNHPRSAPVFSRLARRRLRRRRSPRATPRWCAARGAVGRRGWRTAFGVHRCWVRPRRVLVPWWDPTGYRSGGERRRVLRSGSDIAERGQRARAQRGAARGRRDLRSVDPRRGSRLPAVRPGGGDPAVDDPDAAGLPVRQGVGPSPGPGRGREGGRPPGRGGAAVRPTAPRRSPRQRARPRPRHHHPGRHDPAARRPARVRRRGGHPLRHRPRRALRRHDRRRVRVGEGQARRGAPLGGRPRGRPRGQLGLQRLVLRQPDAAGGRAPGRRQPRSPAAGPRHRAPLARAPPRRARGRPQDPVPERGAAAVGPDARAARAAAVGALRHRRPGAHPRVGSGHRRRQPPQLLRRPRHRCDLRPLRSGRAVPRQARGVRRPGGGPGGAGARRHPGRPQHRIRRAADGGRRRAGQRRAGRHPAAGHDPPGAGVLRARAGGPVGRRSPGGTGQGAGDPARAVGHREGVAPIRAGPPPVERDPPADGPHPHRRPGRR